MDKYSIIIMQMIKLIVLLCLMVGNLGQGIYRLSNKGQTKLSSSQYLYSTLGYFRVKVASASCQLRIQQFIRSKYTIKGYYPLKKMSQPCEYVTIQHNSLSTSTGIKLIQIEAAEISQLSQITFTIDDLGVMRLLLSSPNRNKLTNDEAWISDFREPQQYVYTTSNIIVSLEDTLSFRKNEGGWGFSAFYGQFRLFYIPNTEKIIKYQYSSFSITPNQILDKDNYPPPRATFKDFNYEPKCGKSQFLNFKFPLVFQINPFWPELRVLDQGGYELMKIRYPGYNCYDDLGIELITGNYHCFNWFCPRQTFEHEGNCLRECPYPFYHQIKPNQQNRCVLRCQEGSTIDLKQRVCSCGDHQYVLCGQGAKPYSLGCYCEKGFYDGKKCSSSCPAAFAQINDLGVCASCSYKCKYCRQSKGKLKSFNFIECLQCMDGYTLFEGICRKECIDHDNCCKLKNCVKCDKDRCMRCESPFVLYEGSCVEGCPAGYLLKQEDNGFICNKIKECTSLDNSTNINICQKCSSLTYFCWIDCQSGTFFRNYSACYCQIEGEFAFVQNCKQKQFSCPIKQYLSPYNECLPCPFGCLTCLQDYGGFIECTSCAPAYVLTLDMQWGHYCQTNTALTSCQTNESPQRYFDPNQMICDFGENQTNYYLRKSRLLCQERDENCLTCLELSQTQCSFCKKGFYLYKDKCYDVCPPKTFSYQRNCFDIEVDRCLSAKIVPNYHVFNIEMQTQFMEGYNHFLPSNEAGKNGRIDPVGRIFFYSFLSNKDLQGQREVKFDGGKLACLECQQGYGLDQEGNCKKCVQYQFCLICYNSYENLCALCRSDHKLNSQSICVPKPLEEIECKEDEWRWEDRVCRDHCYGFYRSEADINCTKSCSADKNIQGIFEEYLMCEKGEGYEEYLHMAGTFYELDSSYWIAYLIPENEDFFIPENNGSFAKGQQILSIQSTPSTSTYLTQHVQHNIIVLVASQNVDAMEVQLKAGKLVGEEGTYLANSRYGIGKEDTSYRSVLNQNLSFYGIAYSIVILMITVIYIGDYQLYKTDNAIILFQFLYISLLSMDLRLQYKDLYRFLYGFRLIGAHPFDLEWGTMAMGQGIYIEKAPTTAHYLLNVDNNVIRNIAFTLIFLMVYGIFLISMKVGVSYLSNRLQQDINHNRVLNYSYIFLLQNSVFVIVYFCISNLLSQKWIFSENRGYYFYQTVSAVILAIVVVGSGLRFWMNRVAGIYLLKRILFGIVMGSYSNVFAILILPECLFTLGRLWFEEVQIKNNRYVKYIIVEELLIMVSYVMMEISVYVPQLAIAYLCSLVHLYLAYFIGDLVVKVAELQKLLRRGKEREKEVVKVERIRKLWDHEVNMTVDTINSTNIS